MSKHSVRFVVNEDKYSLKVIIILFILIDLYLTPLLRNHLTLFYLLLYELSVILGLMVGLKGQGRYKQAMAELQSIARDTNLSVEQREHMLVQGIHHYCLELGTLYMERLNHFNADNKKKPKKNEVQKS